MSGKIVLDLMGWDDGQLLYTKGHHDPAEFCEVATRVYGGTLISTTDVYQTYARWCGVFEDGKHRGNYLDYPVKPGRGAFPITYAEEFYCPELDDYMI